MSKHVYTSCGATGDDVGPTLKQHMGQRLFNQPLSRNHNSVKRINAESHVVSQLGMIKQAYNPISNIYLMRKNSVHLNR